VHTSLGVLHKTKCSKFTESLQLVGSFNMKL